MKGIQSNNNKSQDSDGQVAFAKYSTQVYWD